MSIDYSQGRYRVFNTNGIAIGTIDEDEFARIRKGEEAKRHDA